MQRLHRLETEHCSLRAGLEPGCISNPNPNHSSQGKPCVKTHSPDEHAHSTHTHPTKCGGMELPLPHPKGYEPEKAQPPPRMVALLAAQTRGSRQPNYLEVASQRPACKGGSQPCTLKSCDNLFPSDKVREWSLVQLGPPEANVGQKLAQSFDSVAAKSTEPAEAAVNTAATVACQ